MLFKKCCMSENLKQDSSSPKTPKTPSNEKKICVIDISGHRYEVLANKFITWVDGVYHFDGTPLKDKDPRIISIDGVLQGDHKAKATSVPGTLFDSKHQQRVVDNGSCCCTQ